MRRRLFNGLAAVSLALSLAVTLLWNRSIRTPEAMFWGQAGGHFWRLDNQDGSLFLLTTSPWPEAQRLRRIICVRQQEYQGPLPDFSVSNSYSQTGAISFWLFKLHSGTATVDVYDDGTVVDETDPIKQRNRLFYTVTGTLTKGHGVVVSEAKLVFLLVLLPLCWLAATLYRRSRAARFRGATCASCGYDMRATPARCPECGRLAPTQVDVTLGSSACGIGDDRVRT